MQPAPEHSPWPKRLMIAGLVLIFVGVATFSLMMDDFGEYYDPRETSEQSAELGEVNTLTLGSGCWVVHVEGDDSDYIVTYKYIEDGEVGAKVSDDCRTDFSAEHPDVDFSKLTTLDIKDSSEVLVEIECKSDDGCNNPLLFTNGDSWLLEIASDGGFLATMGACCMGAVLFPLGWLLVAINKGRGGKVYLTQDQNIISTDPLEQEMKPNQEMLTTDQLYKLVRGEVPDFEEDSNNVPSPFANVDTRVTKSAPAKVGGSINRASTFTPENPPSDDSWKNWDES